MTGYSTMKIKITATCIIDDSDCPEKGLEFINRLNENNGEAAFEQLEETCRSGTCESKVIAEEA